MCVFVLLTDASRPPRHPVRNNQTFSSVLSTPPLTPPSPNEESQGSDKRAVLRKSVSLSSSDSSSRRRSSSEIDDACDEHFEDHHCDDHEHDGKYHNKDIRKKRFRDATRDASRKNQRRAKERGHCRRGNKRASSCRRLTAVRLVRYTATGWIALRLGWWVYWTSGCREGGYKRATMATGGEGPEQVCVCLFVSLVVCHVSLATQYTPKSEALYS